MVSNEAIYNNLINIRNLEIEYFWQRNIFLFGIQGVILSFFIGSFYSLINSDYKLILLATAFFGLIFAIFIFFILYTSKSWVDYWEGKCKKFEVTYNIEFLLFDRHFESEKPFAGYKSTKKLILSSSGLFSVFWAIMLFYTCYKIF